MITLRSYQNIGEAGFAQSLLEAAGIPAVLDHEAAAVFAPAGMCAVLLRVPEKSAAEADRILAEHPVHFVDMEDEPRFGFWRGCGVALLVYFCVAFLLRMLSGAAHFNGGILFIVCILGGAWGANHRLKKSVVASPKT